MNNIFYKIYHGNLSFSSIEEDELLNVIDKTYLPLLKLVENYNVKIGLEINGYTLEKIKTLKPAWIVKFKTLYEKGLIELVGSGYIQIIGPLVPYEINILNQKIGFKIYKDILGIKPTLAYINEQVFSKSMVDIYAEVGYKAIAMEWNNAYSIHCETWEKEYAFYPVIAKGIESKIPLIWTDTILFQQFQRMAHQEITIDEYIEIIKHYVNIGYKIIPIYSSDLEIFNYRPGRFETESVINADEWEKISKISNKLRQFGEFKLPSEVIEEILDNSIKIDLTNTANPILVKKQNKYSLSRWAACGRGATYINTLCYNCFKNLQNNTHIKKLLQYWGSDYRTHITSKKWDNAIEFLNNCSKINICDNNKILSNDIVLAQDGGKLIFKKDNYNIIFNKSKGLALDKIYKDNKQLQFGTVKHGELDYITHGADFYTGTTTLESANIRKVTDLHEIKDYTFDRIDKNKYKVSALINMKNIAKEYKSWIIDIKEKKITLDIKLLTNDFINGSIRLGTFTLLPQDKNSNFWYECKNGGKNYERFYIDDKVRIEHFQAKSLLQSSSGGLGVTDGILRFGIDEKIICQIEINREVSYPFVMLQNSYDHDKYLTRVFFGLQELDDTLKDNDIRNFKLRYKIQLEYN